MCFTTSLYWYGLLHLGDESYIRIGESVHISARASTVAMFVTIHEVCEVSVRGTSDEEIPRFPFILFANLGMMGW